MRLAVTLACVYAGVAICDPRPVAEVSREAAGQRPSLFSLKDKDDSDESDGDGDGDDDEAPEAVARPFGGLLSFLGKSTSRGSAGRSAPESAESENGWPWGWLKPKGGNGGNAGNGQPPKPSWSSPWAKGQKQPKSPKGPKPGRPKDTTPVQPQDPKPDLPNDPKPEQPTDEGSSETAPGPRGGQTGNSGDGDKGAESQPPPPAHHPDGSGGNVTPATPFAANGQCPALYIPPAADFEYILSHRIDIGKPLNTKTKIYILDMWLTKKSDIDFLRSKGKDVICYFNAGASQTSNTVDNWEFKEADKGAKVLKNDGQAWPGEVSNFILVLEA